MQYYRILNRIDKVAARRKYNIDVESEEDKKERLACEQNFYEFIKASWHTIQGSNPFVEGWHILAIAMHYELVRLKKIEFLIINMPPGYMKSLIAVMFNAWIWTTDNNARFLHLSYSHQLSKAHQNNFRRIVTSAWFQKHWGKKFEIQKDNETEMILSTPGKRISSSVESKYITGMHFHYIIFDDPNSAADTHNRSASDRINEWVDNSVLSRLLPGGVRILIQQRLDEFDLTAHFLSKNLDNIVHLRLPEKYVPETACKTIEINGKVWQDPRTKKDELLWPQFKNAKLVAAIRAETVDRIYLAQYQQEPKSLEGEIFQRKYFQIYDKEFLPEYKFIIQSWDTAIKTGDTNGYSACTTWGIYEDQSRIAHVVLLSTFRAKLTTAQLYETARNMAYDYYNDSVGAEFRVEPARRPHLVIVEDKVNGVGLIEDLSRSGVMVQPFIPKGSKEWRAVRASILVEGKKVWLLAKPGGQLYKFSEEFLEMAVAWPNNRDGTDLIDTMTQTFIFLMEHSDVLPTSIIAHRKFQEFRQLA